MNIKQLPEVTNVWDIFLIIVIIGGVVIIALSILLMMYDIGFGMGLLTLLMILIIAGSTITSAIQFEEKIKVTKLGYAQVQKEIFDVYGLKVSVDEVEILSDYHSGSSIVCSNTFSDCPNVFKYVNDKHSNGVITFGTIDIAQTDEQGLKSIIPITLIKFDNEFILTYGDAEEINELPRNTQEELTMTGKEK